jgi:Xaa-Pro dipeptidase
MIDPQAYRLRQQRVFHYLSQKQIEVGVIVDLEGLRNQSVRYLCGQPGDALLFLFAHGESLLVPWDAPLARVSATVDSLTPFDKYERSPYSCIESVVRERRMKQVELSAALPFPLVQALISSLPGTTLECRQKGIDETINVLRIIKDKKELILLRRACSITNELIREIPGLLGAKRKVTELELALFLEAEARRRGAEGMGFDTLAASARRSYAIHCFPNFTVETIVEKGLSILDFGVRFGGYTSDVTLTLAKKPLSSKQEAMIEAVREAYNLALELCRPGIDPVLVGERIQENFKNRGFHMPHSLGHGIGLDAHEEPSFRRSELPGNEERRQVLQPGMVFTIEPGLYDPEQGGVRLENDLLCTEQGVEVLTSAYILDL